MEERLKVDISAKDQVIIRLKESISNLETEIKVLKEAK